MNLELQELLAAWLGGDIDPARGEALLARLRTDDVFRRAFVEEVRMLGKLKAVQSTQPRWLRLDEELNAGLSSSKSKADLPLDARVLAAIRNLPVRRSGFRWRWAFGAGALALAALLMFVGGKWWENREPSAARTRLALVARMDQVDWDPAQTAPVNEGGLVGPGWMRLRSGRITLAFLNGVTLNVEGPAEVQLLSMDRVYCTRGRLLVYVLPQSLLPNFTVSSPGAAVVDLGTEFGFNVYPGRPSQVMVFRGSVEVSVLATNGTTLRSEIIEENASAEIVPGSCHVRMASLSRKDFLAPPELTMPSLCVDRGYVQAVRQSCPWGYWRFECLTDGTVANEIPDRPGLRAHGSVSLAKESGGNHSARFLPDDNTQSLQLDGCWTPPAGGDYAVEFLFAAEQYKDCMMAALLNDRQEHHVMVELTAGAPHHLLHNPGTFRYVYRQPASSIGGLNVFSSSPFTPYRWHHVVAQRNNAQIQLFVDGQLAGDAEATGLAEIEPCHFLLGRIRQNPIPPMDFRTFAGHLDEVALYDHSLSPAEIRRHAELSVKCGGK